MKPHDLVHANSRQLVLLSLSRLVRSGRQLLGRDQRLLCHQEQDEMDA